MKIVTLVHLLLLVLIDLVLVKSEDVHLPGLGTIRGGITNGAWTGVNIYQFLGVKYAEAAVGPLRFKAPVPVLPWNGIRDATKYGQNCPSIVRSMDLSPEQVATEIEDCISLCVYSKNLTASTPVMVYIHGGAFFDGASSDHPPNYLLEREIVLVVPQYRLGPFGFLSMQSDMIPGNAAMLDLILALEWVQKYIFLFGGDPSQVTLVGQSAGAAIVNTLSFSPLVSDKHYNRVIIQSGAAMGSWMWDDHPIRNARSIATLAGCTSNSTDTYIEDCLMGMNATTLLTGFVQHIREGEWRGLNKIGGHRFTIGGPSNFLPQNPYKIMRSGGGRRNLTMMIGVTKHEGTYVMTIIHEHIKDRFGFNNTRYNQFMLMDTINQIMGVDDPSYSLTGYASIALMVSDNLTSGNYTELLDPLIDLAGTSVAKGPVLRAAQSNTFLNPDETWLYTFDYKGKFTRFGWGADTSAYPFPGGIHHSDDIIYLFPFPENVANLNEKDTLMAHQMVDMWTSFVRTGIPCTTAMGSVQWNPMTGPFGSYFHINSLYTVGSNFLDEFTVTKREGLSNIGNRI